MAGFGFLMKYNYKTIAIISVAILVIASIVGFYLAPMLIEMNLKVDLWNLISDTVHSKVYII